MKDFNDCVQELGLVRLEHVGDRFTWFKGDMKERLDWALCKTEWMSQHQEAKVWHLMRFGSDHRPIRVANTDCQKSHGSRAMFKYDAAWELEETFHDIVEESWKNADWIGLKETFSHKADEWRKVRSRSTERRGWTQSNRSPVTI